MKVFPLRLFGVIRSEIKNREDARSEHQEGDTTMKTNVIGYWATTAFLMFAVLSGGVAELVRRRDNVAPDFSDLRFSLPQWRCRQGVTLV
jgi:hypothetical protein